MPISTSDLRFAADRYGPYTDRLSHLLNALDGGYVRCAKPISDANRFDVIWLDISKRGDWGSWVPVSALKGDCSENFLYALLVYLAGMGAGEFKKPLKLLRSFFPGPLS
jgi:hypothetical protein